jgi:CubicO group peptidase (beta-lactamase class C family)
MTDQFAKIDELLLKHDSTKTPGCAFAIVKSGEIIYTKSIGMASLEHSVTITPSTVFYIASCSKQFAAFCIALLEEKGLLSVHDDVCKYIPEIPDYGRKIEIQHLIRHTSGLRDYLELNSLSGHYGDELITPDDALSAIIRQKRLNFQPGERYLYSNSGYFLISELVLRITGQTLRQFAHENIFLPLGMKNTHFHDDRTEPIPNRAIGYLYRPGIGFRINVPGLETVGSGGIYSSVEDLALWDRNFYDNKHGKGDPALMQRILETTTLIDGKPFTYAFGLQVDKYRGLDRVEHSGSNGSYTAEFARFPGQNLTFICLSNSSLISAPTTVMRAADILLESEFTSQDSAVKTAIVPAELTESDLDGKEGYYFSESGDTSFKIIRLNNSLIVSLGSIRLPLTPSSPDRFHILNMPIGGILDFSVEDGKKILTVDFERGDEPEKLVKLATVDLDAREKQALAGDFHSEELAVTMQVSLSGDELHYRLGRHKGVLVPCENFSFVFESEQMGIVLIRAERKDSQTQRFFLDVGRVQNIEFIRK